MSTYPTILKSIVRVADLHGQQGLALCDHREYSWIREQS